MKAIQKYGRAEPADLSLISQPTWIAIEDHDRLVPTMLFGDLRRRIKNSELIIFPASGSGGIFPFNSTGNLPHPHKILGRMMGCADHWGHPDST